jgi:hypothetical protein
VTWCNIVEEKFLQHKKSDFALMLIYSHVFFLGGGGLDRGKFNAKWFRSGPLIENIYVGVLISLWLFLSPIFLFAAQPK